MEEEHIAKRKKHLMRDRDVAKNIYLYIIHSFALYWPCQTYQYSVHPFLFLFTISSFKFEQETDWDQIIHLFKEFSLFGGGIL